MEITILLAVVILFIIIKSLSARMHDNETKYVKKYKICKKYEDGLMWATYLYFTNEEEGWNQTIPNSFCARNPNDDLTFVHAKKEDAQRYAKSTFPSAQEVD